MTAVKLEYVRMLAIQRDLYRIPRGSGRFRQYLATMLDPETGDLRMPLTVMNPMADDHVPRYIDLLQAMAAEESGARAVEDALTKLAEEPGHYRVGIVVADDAGGGWTNRAATELMHLKAELALERRGWITAILWASETYGPSEIREEVLISIYRTLYVARRGAPRTLREILLQEGSAMRLAGARNPALDPAALLRTREILSRRLDCEDQPTLVAALFGDRAARELGYPPLGLPPRAGIALALHGRLEPRGRRSSRDPSSSPTPSNRPPS
jgi:hypothetical protein